jgi:hypothetical protein
MQLRLGNALRTGQPQNEMKTHGKQIFEELYAHESRLYEFGDAFHYTGADFREWCSEAGFRRFEFIPLAGPTSAAIAYK